MGDRRRGRRQNGCVWSGGGQIPEGGNFPGPRRRGTGGEAGLARASASSVGKWLRGAGWKM